MRMVEDLVSDCANLNSPNYLALNLDLSKAAKGRADLHAQPGRIMSPK
jgi:hypothetical protein